MPFEPPAVLSPEARPVAPADVAAESWAAAFPRERRALVLAPGSPDGWFRGRPVVACDPEEIVELPGTLPFREPYRPAEPLARAGALLDAVFGSSEASLAAALLTYEGALAAALFRRGLVLAEDGWRPWGDWSSGPAVPRAPARHRGAKTPRAGSALATGLTSSMSRTAHRRAVLAVHEAIRRGDVYVLNLTRTLRGEARVPRGSLFAALVERSRADMAACWSLPGRDVSSGSPERFVRVTAGRGRRAAGTGAGTLAGARVEIAPIKGTRPRGARPGADALLASELASSAKERAEHVMIVDLERNDLGRVCVPGSVGVSPLLEVRTTPYCHQMVSCVQGTVAAGIDSADLLAATFPCGSVTGAPKFAAMKAVAGLEGGPRGLYTGSLVVAVPGAIDSSVLIRTAELAEDGAVSWGTGGGVTIDSDPAEEWRETVLKAVPLTGATRTASR